MRFCKHFGRAFALALALGAASPALAQSTAQPVIPGYLTTTVPQANCATAPCFVPSGGAGSGGSANAGPVSNTPAVTAGAYTANYAIGGLQTVPLFRTTAQPSGVLDYVSVASKSGVTAGIVEYMFTKSPSSTCTDDQAFVLNSADLAYLVAGFPITLTPAATAGTTQTTANQAIPVSVSNQDTTPSKNVYVCAVTTGTPSPGSTSDLVFNFAIVRD